MGEMEIISVKEKVQGVMSTLFKGVAPISNEELFKLVPWFITQEEMVKMRDLSRGMHTVWYEAKSKMSHINNNMSLRGPTMFPVDPYTGKEIDEEYIKRIDIPGRKCLSEEQVHKLKGLLRLPRVTLVSMAFFSRFLGTLIDRKLGNSVFYTVGQDTWKASSLLVPQLQWVIIGTTALGSMDRGHKLEHLQTILTQMVHSGVAGNLMESQKEPPIKWDTIIALSDPNPLFNLRRRMIPITMSNNSIEIKMVDPLRNNSGNNILQETIQFSYASTIKKRVLSFLADLRIKGDWQTNINQTTMVKLVGLIPNKYLKIEVDPKRKAIIAVTNTIRFRYEGATFPVVPMEIEIPLTMPIASSKNTQDEIIHNFLANIRFFARPDLAGNTESFITNCFNGNVTNPVDFHGSRYFHPNLSNMYLHEKGGTTKVYGKPCLGDFSDTLATHYKNGDIYEFLNTLANYLGTVNTSWYRSPAKFCLCSNPSKAKKAQGHCSPIQGSRCHMRKILKDYKAVDRLIDYKSYLEGLSQPTLDNRIPWVIISKNPTPPGVHANAGHYYEYDKYGYNLEGLDILGITKPQGSSNFGVDNDFVILRQE